MPTPAPRSPRPPRPRPPVPSAAAVLLGVWLAVGTTACVAVESDPKPAPPEALARRLGSKDDREREAAEKALRAMGERDQADCVRHVRPGVANGRVGTALASDGVIACPTRPARPAADELRVLEHLPARSRLVAQSCSADGVPAEDARRAAHAKAIAFLKTAPKAGPKQPEESVNEPKRDPAFDRPPEAVRVRAKAPVPKADEPAWMAAFRQAYRLKDGEYVRRVAPPYPAERAEFLYRTLHADKQTPEDEKKSRARLDEAKSFMALFVEADGTALTTRSMYSANPLLREPRLRNGDNTMTVWEAVTRVTRLSPPAVRVDPAAIDHPLFSTQERIVNGSLFEGVPNVDGDFVIRTDAPLDQLAAQLEAILRDECGLAVRLAVERQEQTVYAVGGTFAVRPRDWRKAGEIDICAVEAVLNKGFDRARPAAAPESGVATEWDAHTPESLTRHLGEFLKARLVWDTPAPREPRVYTYTHERAAGTAAEQAARDPDAVLKNVGEQTGLTFTKERRKVPALVLSVAEKK